jgi:signal transduction histidine kinase/DNA-binding NarL/FixJ family response regulator
MTHSTGSPRPVRQLWPRIVHGARASGLGRAWRWLTLVHADDPVRYMLNRGFAAVMLALILINVPLILTFIVNGEIVKLLVSLVAIPCMLFVWWLNRRGLVYGALLFTLWCVMGSTLGIPPSSIHSDTHVPIILIFPTLISTLFIRPRAGLWASVLQITTVGVMLGLSHIDPTDFWRFMSLTALNLIGIVPFLIVGATIFSRALRSSIAVNAELERLNAGLEQRVAERTSELQEAKDAAEEANHYKSHFLANMSHELRTPLNAVLGYAQMLRRDRTLDERQVVGLTTIQQSGEHLLAMIDDILDLAKVEAGKLELAATAVHLPSFLKIIADIIRIKAEQKNLLFTCEVSPDLPDSIRTDPQRLREILLNLLDNAVKFTEHGSVALRVEVAAWSLEVDRSPIANLRFVIEDSGIGIPPDQLERIFQPFEQVGRAQRRVEGTGLGLAISRQLVGLMGGDLLVKSDVGQGSRFWFELALPVTDMPGTTQSPSPAIVGYAGPRHTVLIVDDIDTNRTMLVQLLVPLGFDIVEATNGQEAFALAQALHPDLIMLDMRMPLMDGLEVTRRLRQLPDLRATPIIAVSASASKADQAKSLEVGASAFTPKPIDLDALLPEIGRLLQLTWLYEPAHGGLAEPGPAQTTPLEVPPPEELEVLYDLAFLGKMRQLRERAATLEQLNPKYRPFAAHLEHLAKGFNINQVQVLLKQYMEADLSST